MNEETRCEVDVEQIMRSIRREIQMAEDINALPAFEDIPLRVDGKPAESAGVNWDEFYRSLEAVNCSCEIPYYWVMGPRGFKTFMKRVMRKLSKCMLMPILEKQNILNANFVRCHNAFRYFSEDVRKKQQGYDQDLERLNGGLAAAKDDIWRLAAEGETSDAALREMEQTIQRLEQTALNSEERLRQSEESLRALSEKADRMERRIVSLDKQSDAFSAAAARTIMDYMKQEGLPVESSAGGTEEKKQQDSGDTYMVLDYFKFQNEFRGTKSTIYERLGIYLPYFKDSVSTVLDVGCGRGEFLQLMRDNGVPAIGVDLYPEYVVEGKLNGVDIRCCDGIEFLKNADTQFGGIFSSQVIEHISFAQLQELCAAAYEKLLPGAYLILETPNPTCLSVYTTTFYVDPTHNKPIHPLLLEYLVREVGFKDVQIVFPENSTTGLSLPQIEGDGITNLDEVNRAIRRVSDLLYGCLDYAVIAKK